MSRQDFILGRWLKANRSPADKPEGQTRDAVVEYGGEFAGISLIGLMALRAAREKQVRFIPRGKPFASNHDFAGYQKATQEISDLMVGLPSQLAVLGDAWRSAYSYEDLEVEWVPVTTCDANGANCTIKTEPRYKTVTKWREPESLVSSGLSYETIRVWKRNTGEIHKIAQEVSSTLPQVFDFSGGTRSVVFEEHIEPQGTTNALVAIEYGSIAALYAFYEESVDKLYKYYGYDYDDPPIDSNKFIKRRTFLKLLLLSFSTPFVSKMQAALAAENEQLARELRLHLQEVVRDIDTPSDIRFSQMYGPSPKEVRQLLSSITQVTGSVLETHGSRQSQELGESWPNIREQMRDIHASARDMIQRFDDYFSFDRQTEELTVPQDLLTALNNAWATREIVDYTSGRNVRLDLKHHAVAGLLGLYLFAGLFLSEKVVLPVSDAVIDAIARD